jgi:hypothetical protein
MYFILASQTLPGKNEENHANIPIRKVDLQDNTKSPKHILWYKSTPHLPAVMEENHEKYQDNEFPGKESNPEPPEHQCSTDMFDLSPVCPSGQFSGGEGGVCILP